MPYITVCSKCGKLYEEVSEEEANNPSRVCVTCYRAKNSAESPKSNKFVKLWEAINKYVVACGGDTGRGVYGNVVRQEAVSQVEMAVIEVVIAYSSDVLDKNLALLDRLRDLE